jgi:hypothetical protein
MAASIGVTEVFKLVYGVPAEVAPCLEREYFNLFSLTDDDPAVGPDLPPHPSLPDTLLLGGGAIGNAIAHLLERVRPRGRLIIIDKDAFAPENRGTCMLLDDRDWLKRSKAEALAEYLTPGYGGSVAGWRGRIEDAIGGDLLQGYDIDLVLGGSMTSVPGEKSNVCGPLCWLTAPLTRAVRLPLRGASQTRVWDACAAPLMSRRGAFPVIPTLNASCSPSAERFVHISIVILRARLSESNWRKASGPRFPSLRVPRPPSWWRRR